jgi:DNA-binding NarL/FixJ family response regulator
VLREPTFEKEQPMFDFLTDAVENALDVADSVLSGEDVTKRQVARLVSDGLSIAAIASATGLAVEIIEKMVDD